MYRVFGVVFTCEFAAFTRTWISWLLGSSSVSIAGPIGLDVSAFLPRHMVRSENCQARSLRSLPSVYPSTQLKASSFDRFFALRPMTATNSPSNWTGPTASDGMTMVSPLAISALGER